MKWIAIVALAIAGNAMGQTTRPATRPLMISVRAEDLNSLRTEIEKLRAEVVKLRSENARLKSGVDAWDAKMQQAAKDGVLAVGMTLAQADAILKKKYDGYTGYTLESETGDQKYYEFNFSAPYDGRRRIGEPTSWSAWIKDGKIIEWSK